MAYILKKEALLAIKASSQHILVYEYLVFLIRQLNTTQNESTFRRIPYYWKKKYKCKLKNPCLCGLFEL